VVVEERYTLSVHRTGTFYEILDGMRIFGRMAPRDIILSACTAWYKYEVLQVISLACGSKALSSR
jgi:hypothetical protein